MSDLSSAFESAAAEAKSLSKMTNEKLLSLYKHFKQATVGDCTTDRPGMFDPKGRAKWDAWDSLRGMSQEDAKQAYVSLVKDYSA